VDPDHQRFAQLVTFPQRWGRIQPGFVRGRLPLGRLAADVRGPSTSSSSRVSLGQRDTKHGMIAYRTRPIAWLHRLTCDEAPEEPKNVKTDKVLKLDCNININTNYMLTGIKDVSAGSSGPSSSGSLVAKPGVFFSCRLRRALIRRSKRLRPRSEGRRFIPSESPLL
jgi:hypothetical protein